MAYETKNLRGSLFKNNRKERKEQPDYKGTSNVDGVIYQVSAWITKAQSSGLTYMSLSYTKASDLPGGRESSNMDDFADDDIPF